MSLSTPESVRKLRAALHAKAKGSLSYRFYTVYDKLYRADVLAYAYRCCRSNGGAAGVDGQDFADIEAYGLERWLGELAEELRKKTNQPQAVRRVWIPKPDGKQRPLGIPTVKDRVVQMAAVLVLEPIFEADLQPEQYAYRPERSALDAVRKVHSLVNTGHTKVVDADLSGYFDSIPHAELMKSVARRISDRHMLHLIKMWLQMPVEEKGEQGHVQRTTRNKDEHRGTPQGAPISPLLSNLDGSAGALEELQRIIAAIRERWPATLILIRGDSGFCREPIMAWCEQNGVHYLLGLAKNERLQREIEEELACAKAQFDETGKPARVFKDFRYSTLDSWSRERRVVGKAEHLEKGPNPRFVVTSLPPEQREARSLYENVYCARGDMENRIKEQQLCLFADRTSSTAMRANELRLWFSSVGYTLMTALQRLGLQGTELAPAQCDTIRLKLLKIGARIRVTVRKVWVSLAESFPYRPLFQRVYENLIRRRPLRLRC
jgi:hypothetical protein